MENRKRNIQMRFWVTSEEKKLIRRKMYMAKTNNMGAYLRKMAIDGIVANVDMTYQKEKRESEVNQKNSQTGNKHGNSPKHYLR